MNVNGSFFPRLKWILKISGVFILLMTIYRLFFFYVYRTPEVPLSGTSLWMGFRFDLRVVAVLALSLFILSSIPFLNPFQTKSARKFWIPLLTIVFMVFLIAYVSDFYHYDYLNHRLSASVLIFLEDAMISAQMMWETYPVIPVLIGLIVLLFLWVKLMRYWLTPKNLSYAVTPKKTRIIISVLYVLVCGMFIFGKLGQYPLRWSDAYAIGNEFKANVTLNPFQSFFSTMKFRHSGFDAKKVREYYPMLAAYLNVSDPSVEKLNFERSYTYNENVKPNIVLVICESFAAPKSTMFGNMLNPTPYFDSLSKQGAFFTRCFTPSFGTARGVWSTVTGVPDVNRPKTASRNPLAVDQKTIINDFEGYEKFYFLGGSTTWANIRGVLANNIEGIQIIEQDHFKSGQEDVWGISDKNLFLESNQILSKVKKPFFAIIQTANNHRPYTIPDEDLNEFKKEEHPKDTLKKYLFKGNDEFNAFRYMDFAIQKYMEAAAKEAYFENTIFVFIGDHGLRGAAPYWFPKSFSKYDFQSEHVPLLFYSPKFVKPETNSGVCSQLDVLPSIAHLAKQNHRNTSLGMNLFSEVPKERYAFIADPDKNSIAVVGNEYYWERSSAGVEAFASVLNDDPIPQTAYADSVKNYMKKIAEAFQETSRYLLLNNKKVRRIN